MVCHTISLPGTPGLVAGQLGLCHRSLPTVMHNMVGTDKSRYTAKAVHSSLVFKGVKFYGLFVQEKNVAGTTFPNDLFLQALTGKKLRGHLHLFLSEAVRDKVVHSFWAQTPRVCAACGKAETVEKKLSKCAGCQSLVYCDAACQKDDWRRHKPACRI